MIYFITQQDKFIKIGVGNNPEERLATLQTGNPQKLTLWFCIPGGYDEEKLLHSFFGCVRESGEWFKLTPGLRDCLWDLVTKFNGSVQKFMYAEKFLYDSYPVNQEVIAKVDKI